jgi:TonB-linked SusC/RagA family outer membrane protein
MPLTANGKALPCLSLKMLLIMKITALFVLAGCLGASAGSMGQITLSEKSTPLARVLKEIKQQSGYSLFYDEALVQREGKPVDVRVHNLSLEEALDAVFSHQVLTYELTGTTILVKQKDPVRTPAPSLRYGDFPLSDTLRSVQGNITNENGEPLQGATVTVKATNTATETNSNGQFSIGNVRLGTVLVISFTGYATTEVKIRMESQGYLHIRMPVSTNVLDEVQVVAYGTTSRRYNTGNVTTVEAKDIEMQPVDNPLLALEGRVPGLFITQAAGVPGSGVTTLIRGQNSISSGNDPLYIIDGVPYPSLLLNNQGFVLGSSGNGITGVQSMFGNPLSSINPSDIESISVLKDASATAIYGSRGANGVILITTKKGKAGQTKVDVNVQSGFGHVAHFADLLNTRQYLEMREEALKNDGITPSLANGDYDLLLWDTTRYTNWQKALIGNTSSFTNAQASVSGGTANTQFLIGGDYNRQTTVFPGNSADQKGSIHFNINNTPFNKKFNIALTGSYMVQDNRLPYADFTSTALALAPDAPSLYNPDGTLNWAPNSTGTSTFSNPLAALNDTYLDKTNNLIANTVLSYQILQGLKISSNFGYNNLQVNDQALLPNSSVAPEDRNIFERYASFINNNINSWIAEPQLSYDKLLGGGKLSVLLGSTLQQINSNSQQLQGLGQNSDLVLQNLGAASTIIATSDVSTYKYAAMFGRVDYNWADKYLVDLTARRDGSSRFGSANEFHDFGAAGVGWIFSKEAFVRKALPFLSFGKLRGSYGTTGNDKIGDYQFLSLYNTTSVGRAYQGAIGLTPAGLPNPDIEWELTRKLEVGLETGFLRDRILFNVSYSQNRTSNQLLAYALPIIAGFSSITNNFPATVQNSDWEFTLNTTNIRNRDWGWSTNVNLTIPQNKLVAFPNLSTSTYANSLVIGQPITITKVYRSLGVDPASGLYKFASATNPFNPQYTVDNTAIVNTAPRMYAGMQNSLHFKQIQLDFLLQYVRQTGPNALYTLGDPGTFNRNQLTSVMGRWQNPGDVTNIQRFNSTNSDNISVVDASSSTAGYSDDSYLRLKNVSLSWNLNPSWIGTKHVQSVRIYLQGQNLLTFTKYKGLDPENLSVGSLPPLRVVAAGVQVGL